MGSYACGYLKAPVTGERQSVGACGNRVKPFENYLENVLGSVSTRITLDKAVSTLLKAYDYSNTTNGKVAELSVNYPAGGEPYAIAPNIIDTKDSSAKNATTAWVTKKFGAVTGDR